MQTLSSRTSSNKSGYDALAAKLQQVIVNEALVNRNPHRVKFSVGLESVSAAEQAELSSAIRESAEQLEETVGETEWNEELSQAQQDAGVILLNAASDPQAYHSAATAEVSASDAVLDASAVDVANISTESYDAREIENTLARSIAFNIGAARQQPALELLFPTITVTPDQAGLTLSVTRNMVHNHFVHNAKGLPTAEQFGNKSLIDALIDSSILHNRATDIVPSYDDTLGIFDTEVGKFPVTVGNTAVDSGSILFGQPFNLIGVGANAITDPFGVRDQTDTVDSMVRLKQVYVEFEEVFGTKSIVPFDVRGLSQTGFLKGNEGNDRGTILNWNTTTLHLTGTTKDKTNVEAPALHALRNSPYDNYVVMLKVSATGNLNLADGNAELNAGNVSIADVYETVTLPTGQTDLQRIEDTATVDAVKAFFTSIKLRSFTLDARYANLNRRERGLLVRAQTERKKYIVPLTAPISALKPITDTATEFTIDAAVQTARVSNTTAGVHALMEFDEAMHRYKGPINRHYKPTDLDAIGVYFLRPYYERKVFDFMDNLSNLGSANKQADIGAALCLSLRDSFAKAIQISGWNAAQECLTGGGKEAPTAAIVCDPRVAQFLVVQGDNRLFGDHYKVKVETSDYLEFRSRIFMVVRRENSVNEPDGLNFGNMIWLPELSTNLPVSRTGQISHEFTIQPRRRHIVHCPILVRYDLVNLDKVVDVRVPVTIVQ